MVSKSKDPPAPTRDSKAARGNKRLTKRSVNADAQVRVDRVVELTMLGKDNKTIAAELGISPVTVRDIRQRSDYRERYQQARDEAFRLTMDRLAALQAAAVTAHIRALGPENDAKVQLAAAQSILDRTGVPKQTKVEQSGEVTVSPHIDMSPFDGRTIEEKRHYLEHGVFPDGSKPVAQ